MHRHGRGGLSSLRTRTPYERPTGGSKRPESVAHEEPNDNQRMQEPPTPGLFSRVRSLLSPAKLWSTGKRSKLTSSGVAVEHDQDRMNEESSSPPITPFRYPPPQLDLDTIAGSVRRESPNERLRQFFVRKGDEKLTDMEVEGVMSLIRQAAQQNESVIDIDMVNGSDDASKRRRSDTPGSAMAVSPATPNSKKGSSQQPFTTPVIGLSKSPSTYTPLYRSSTTSTASNSSTKSSIVQSRPSTPNLRFMDIPTPYRPARRSLPPRSEPGVAHDEDATGGVPDSAEKRQDDIAEKTVPEATKPMSQTASVLLSLLDEGKKEETKTETKAPNVKPFVNPYAASPRRATPLKRKEPAAVIESTAKKTPLQQIEQSKPKFSTHVQSQPAPIAVDKYKPARSSSLRQSIVASNDSPPAKKALATTTDQSTPSNLFQLSPASTALFEPPTVETANTDLSPSKPLFHTRNDPSRLNQSEPFKATSAPAPAPSLFSIMEPQLAKPVLPAQTLGKPSAVVPFDQPLSTSMSLEVTSDLAAQNAPKAAVISATPSDQSTVKDYEFPDIPLVPVPTLSASDLSMLERLRASSFAF